MILLLRRKNSHRFCSRIFRRCFEIKIYRKRILFITLFISFSRGAENRTRSSCSQSKCTTGILRPGSHFVVYDSVAICTYYLAFFDFFFDTSKSNRTTESSYCEHFIFVVFVVKIKHSRISNSTLFASSFRFVFVEPLKIPLYECLFGKTITVGALSASINFS